MEIQINCYPINFELENEQTVLDVVNSISDWVKKRNLVFTEVYIDGEKHLLEDVPDLDIGNVKLINSVVQSKSDIVISSVDEGIRYCDRVINFIKEKFENNEIDINNISHIASGIDWLIEVLSSTINLIGLNQDDFKYKDKVLGFYIEEITAMKNNVLELQNESKMIDLMNQNITIFQNFKEILAMIILSDEMKNLIMNSVESPDTLIVSLKNISEGLPLQIKNIEEIAVAFQTGNDSEGSEKIGLFIDFIYQYIKTCYQISPVFDLDLSEVVIEGVSLLDKNSEIHNFLNEISEVMENNDIISLADILEYEMMPLMESIKEFLELLLEKIGS